MGKLIEMSSRRTPSSGLRRQPEAADWDLLPIGALLWIGSVARVALAFAAHETFGAEATLALACVFGLPWLLWQSLFASRAG
jgi:hypothetical protein